jgi:AraC-like DNA-binding protein
MKRNDYYQKMVSPIFARHTDSPFSSNKDFHYHDNYEIFLFLNGKAEAFVEQSRYTLVPGNLLIFNNQEIHKSSNLNTSTYERITIHFHPAFVQPFPGCTTNLLECFENHLPGLHNITLLDSIQMKEYHSLAVKLIKLLNSDMYGKDVLTLTCLAELLLLTNDAFSHAKETFSEPFLGGVLTDVLSYIDNNLHSPLSLECIAQHLSVNKYYLSHQFKKQTGSSLYHFILIKKMALAKKLLTEGYSVLDVCESTGFNDYNNFIRTFKNYTGSSPGQYKKVPQ